MKLLLQYGISCSQSGHNGSGRDRWYHTRSNRVELEVYVSGNPTPTSSQIRWHRLDLSEILNSDPGVVFQDGRRLFLSNVQLQQAGVYECEAVVSLSPFMGTVTSIVYGE